MTEETAPEARGVDVTALDPQHPYVTSAMMQTEQLVRGLWTGELTESKTLAELLALHGAVRAYHAWETTFDTILKLLDALSPEGRSVEFVEMLLQLRTARTEHATGLFQGYVRSALRGLQEPPTLFRVLPEEEEALKSLLLRGYAALLAEHAAASEPSETPAR